VNSITPTLEYKRFFQVRKKRNVVGIRFLTAFTSGYDGKAVPPLTRLYMGGEQDVRGFYIRTITPVAFIATNSPVTINYVDPTTIGSNGLPVTRQLQVPLLAYQFSFPGGDIEGVGNFEYRIPIYKQYVGISYFLDVGVNGILRPNQLQLNSSGYSNLTTTFPTVPISRTIPLAQNSNFYPRSSTGLELVVQLPIIQVPFRIYYAYNISRYSEEVQPPRGEYFLSDAVRATLPPGVLVQQVLPQLNSLLDQNSKRLLYSEPLHVIRFTVARTF